MKASIILCVLSLFLLKSVFGQDSIHQTLPSLFQIQNGEEKSISFPLLGSIHVNLYGIIDFFSIKTNRISSTSGGAEKTEQTLSISQDTNNASVGSNLKIESMVRRKKLTTPSIIKAIWPNDEHVHIPKTLTIDIEAYLSDIPLLVQEEMLTINSIQFGIDEEGQLFLIDVNALKPSIAMQFWIESWKLKSAQNLRNTQINISL